MTRTLVVLPTDNDPLREDLAQLIGGELVEQLTDAQLRRVAGAVFAAAHRELKSGPIAGQLELGA